MKNWQFCVLIANLWLIAGTSQVMSVGFLVLGFMAWLFDVMDFFKEQPKKQAQEPLVKSVVV